MSGAFDPRMKWTQDEKPKKEAPDLMFGKDELLLSEFKFNPCKIRMIKYDMRSFMEQCIDRYRELCGTKYKASLRHVDTPFLDESRPEFDVNPDRPAVNALLGHPQYWRAGLDIWCSWRLCCCRVDEGVIRSTYGTL